MNRLVIFMMLFLLAAAAPDRAREANSAYERGDYAAAEQAYRDAIEANPGDGRLHFNLGNALAQQGRADDAIESYERFRSLARTPEERALADYNIGNLLAGQEQWEEAAEQFRRSLRQNPNDEDASNNFEFARRQLQEQQQQQQPDQQQDQQEQQQQDSGGAGDPQQGQPEDSDDGDGSGDAQAGEDEQDGESGDGDQQQDGGETGPDQQLPQPQPGQMSQQEAEQLLNAISGREQDLIRDFLKDLAEPAEPTEKDW